MGLRIIVDSTADIYEERKGSVTVIPLTILFGSDEYIDGVTIDHKQFYEMLENGDVLPTTSQATPEQFTKVFAEVKAAGDEAVVIIIASALSGTCQSAIIAAQDYDNIYVVDSDNVTIGAGVLVEYAFRLAEQGMSAAEIAKELNEKMTRVRLVAMVDTLEYLKRGGRISRTVAFAGSLLNIKPVINVQNGEIGMLGKARGVKQGMVQLRNEIEKAGDIDFEMPVLMGYTGLDDANLKRFVAESAEVWGIDADSLHCAAIGSVVGTHAGPGAFAAAFFAKE